MHDFDISKIIEKYNKFSNINYINGNETENEFDGHLKHSDLTELNRAKREKLSFVNHSSINYSGIESDDFKARIEKTEEQEFQNRMYIANNYRGFGYKKNLEDFESTMLSILKSSISIVDADKNKKQEMIDKLQNNLMKAFQDKSLSNDEVKEKISKSIAETNEEFGVNLSNNIAQCSYILIDKFRLSLYNLKESDLNTKHKDNLLGLQKNNLNLLNKDLKDINSYLPVGDRIEISDIMKQLRGRERFNSDFADDLIKKMGLENPLEKEEIETKKHIIKKITDMELYGSNVERYAKQISELNKYERLSSIALNYILAEKNGIDAKQVNHKVNLSDFISSFNNIIVKGQNGKDFDKKNLLSKIAKNVNNESRLNGYVDRVHERINQNDKLNFAFEKDEIRNAIKECAKMFENYAENKSDLTNENSIVFKKLNDSIENKISNPSGKTEAYREADVLETISNTLKDNLYNKLISDKYQDIEKVNEYKINILKNLEEDKYGFNPKKNEDVLSCDNMQKIFKMISSKTMTTSEALALVENNKDILKSFSQQERNSVIDLIEDISAIKKKEALLRKNNSPYKDYLFEDLKKKDEDYQARMSAAEDLKRKHISHILNDGKRKQATLGNAISLLTAANGPAIVELKHCAEKQVETRKMDTGLSMASQCLDTYRQKTEGAMKELENNLKSNLSNPMIAMSGISTFILFLYVMQKGRLATENYEILKNEEDITKIVNHIDSVNEQKIKDGLAILYKLKNSDLKKQKPESFTVEKELFMETKKDLFFSELLIASKDSIKTKDGNKPLDELAYSKDNALENFKDILSSSSYIKYDLKEIVNELKERESNILNDKKYAYYLNEEKYGLEVARLKNTEIENLKQDLDGAIDLYKKTMQKTLPNLKNELEDAKQIFNPENIQHIKDESTQKELRSMLRSITNMQETMKEVKSDLVNINDKMKMLKRERENISPFIDILNEEKTAISTHKLNMAIKENPDKIISMFNNLGVINHSGKEINKIQQDEINQIKKKLFFNIIDRAANENDSDLLTSDFFNEVITKAIPHNKNLIEDVSDYSFTSSEHPNNDKIILNITKKEQLSSYDVFKDKIKDSIYDGANKTLDGLEETLDGKTLPNFILDSFKNLADINKSSEEDSIYNPFNMKK